MLNEADHSYTGLITGAKRSSVTTVLAEEGWIDKRFYREGFQDLGTQVHKLLHAHDKRLRFTAPDIYLRYIKPWDALLTHLNAEVIDSEVEVEDLALGVSGTLDRLLRVPGHGVGLLDIKISSCGYLAWHELQTAAYECALVYHPVYGSLKIDWRGGIIIGPDCEMPRLMPHDRMQGAKKIWQATAISNAAKHRYKVAVPEITQEEGWLE